MDHIVQGIGKKMLELRKRRKLTLAEMAKGVGMSPSMISQMERGMLRPSLETLIRVSEFFEVSPADLIDGAGGVRRTHDLTSVTHPIGRKAVVTKDNIRISLLSSKLEMGSEFILMEYPPNSSAGENKFTHEGIECGYVISGVVTVEVGNEVHNLEAGDSITYRSTRPHRTMNRTSETAVAVWMNSEPFIFTAK
jgi:transcriptional regulator with XRE-family HTH domain